MRPPAASRSSWRPWAGGGLRDRSQAWQAGVCVTGARPGTLSQAWLQCLQTGGLQAGVCVTGARPGTLTSSQERCPWHGTIP